jgi:hypothetical protein
MRCIQLTEVDAERIFPFFFCTKKRLTTNPRDGGRKGISSMAPFSRREATSMSSDCRRGSPAKGSTSDPSGTKGVVETRRVGRHPPQPAAAERTSLALPSRREGSVAVCPRPPDDRGPGQLEKESMQEEGLAPGTLGQKPPPLPPHGDSLVHLALPLQGVRAGAFPRTAMPAGERLSALGWSRLERRHPALLPLETSRGLRAGGGCLAWPPPARPQSFLDSAVVAEEKRGRRRATYQGRHHHLGQR